MYNKINEQIKLAMKAKDTNKLSVLRILKSDIITKAKELRVSEDKLEQNVIITVTEKTLKKYKEELSFIKDEVKIIELKSAIELLESYLPDKLNIDEVKSIISKIAENTSNTGNSIGEAMKILSKELKGKVDMKEVKKLVDGYFKSK